MGSPQGKTTHRSLQRAVAILRAFTLSEPELSVTAISRRLGLHKSTVSRILATLQDEGLVIQSGVTGKYALGLDLIGLAETALERFGVSAVAVRHLHTLAGEVSETVSLSVRSGGDVVAVACATGARRPHGLVWPLRRACLTATAAGLALLAESLDAVPAPDQESWLRSVIGDGGTPQLVGELRKIHEDGCAWVVDELGDGIAGLAVPVAVDAAVSIHAPVLRLGPEERRIAIEPLQRAAAAIAVSMGVARPTSAGVDR